MRLILAARELALRSLATRAIACSILVFFVAGCATDTFLSQSGPSLTGVTNRAQVRVPPAGPEQQLAFALVPFAGAGQSISHQWWEQSLNTIGQGAFALGAWRLLHPSRIRSLT